MDKMVLFFAHPLALLTARFRTAQTHAQRNVGTLNSRVKIIGDDKQVTITNDGATIMEKMKVFHPAAKMLVELSQAQDVEAGDGTTTVVIIAGALLSAAQNMLEKGIHPSIVSDAFAKASKKSVEILRSLGIPLDLSQRDSLLKSAQTALNSKVVNQYSGVFAPIAVDAVLRVIDPKTATNVNLKDIRIVQKLGGTVEETELIDGIVFSQKASHQAGGPTTVRNAKIALIQFQLSAPKTNMENNVIISDYTQMDRFLKEERDYILDMCKQIKKSGCNVLLIQKSILRDATNELSLHFLAKLKIMVIKDIERDEVEFICRNIGCQPIPSIESFTADKLGKADLVEEIGSGVEAKVVKITGVPNPGRTVSVLIHGSNKLVLDEAERSLHDALCVIRSIVKEKRLIAGGGAPEIELALQLSAYAKTLSGAEAHCVEAYANSLEIIPYTLAENAGLNPISIVTELRNRHVKGEKTAGINVKSGQISDILLEGVVQPLLVDTSAISLATETVNMILKIDDIVATIR
jgi:T-complex protein 1 subunit delta